MDATRFDALVRSWDRGSRRDSLRWLAGGALGGTLTWLGTEEAAAKNKKKKKKPKKKPKKAVCEGGCADEFFCCPDGSQCCPVVGLPICCPWGCCPADPTIFCGPDPFHPCVRSEAA